MSKSFRGVAALAVGVAVLALGNPGLDDFAQYAQARLQQQPGMGGVIAGLVPGLTHTLLLSQTRRSNYGVFSVYRLGGGGEPTQVFVGVLWNFLPLGRAGHDGTSQ